MSKNTNGDYESWDYWIDESVDDDGKNINKSDEIDLAFQKYIAPYMKIAMTKEVVDGDGQKGIFISWQMAARLQAGTTPKTGNLFFILITLSVV